MAHQGEGTGYDSIPTVLGMQIVDHWVGTDDSEAFAAMRAIVRREVLPIGSSCGSTMAGAYQSSEESNIGEDKRVAVLLDAPPGTTCAGRSPRLARSPRWSRTTASRTTRQG